MTRTLSLPCVGALGATHSSLPTQLSRDQPCSPHRVQQSCLLASKRRKENLKPHTSPRPPRDFLRDLSRSPQIVTASQPPCLARRRRPQLRTDESSLTPTHKLAREPGTSPRFRTPQLWNGNQPQLPPRTQMFQGLQPTPKTPDRLVCQKKLWRSLDGNSTHFKLQPQLVQGRRVYWGQDCVTALF